MPKIEDFGEKIGGARKDLYRLDRELRVDDITDWSDIDRDKYITKKEVFPRPDYDKLYAEGMDREVLFFIKRIRDALPSKPEPHLPYNVSAEEKRALLHSEQEKYIRSVGEIYTKAMELKTFRQCEAFCDQLRENENISAKYIHNRKFIKAADLDNNYSISLFHRDLVKKQFLYSDSEKKLSKYSVLYYNGSNISSVEMYGNRKALEIQAGSGSRYYSYNNGELGDLNNWKADTYFALDEKRQVVLINSETKQQLQEKLLEIENVKAASVNSKKRKGKFIPPQLKHIRPTKQDHRQGRNITGEDMMNIFGFRAGEFGNWETENDKQTNLNMSYDAFKDLANSLGISDADVSLGGQLAIAYGSRGVKSAAAHFEPGANVINLTKMNGAGSLGHEWGHALDFYISQTMGYSSIFASDGAFSKDNIIYDVMDAIKYTEDNKRTKYLQDAMKLDALHSKDAQGYWQSNVELFARAFASYVHDKLGESDYLVGHSEAQSADGTHISPQGEERKRINLEFDRLINNLKERKLLTKRLDNDLTDLNSVESEELSVQKIAANMPENELQKKSLFSIEQNGERREYINNGNSFFDLINIGCSENAYSNLMRSGKQINFEDYAEIQQSENFVYSVDFNFDEKEVRIYEVVGSYAEPYRTDENSSIKTYDLDTIKDLVTEIVNETADPLRRQELFEERLELIPDKSSEIRYISEPLYEERQIGSGEYKQNSGCSISEKTKTADRGKNHSAPNQSDPSYVFGSELEAFRENTRQYNLARIAAKEAKASILEFTDITGAIHKLYWNGATYTDRASSLYEREHSGVFKAQFEMPQNTTPNAGQSQAKAPVIYKPKGRR